MAVGVAMVEEAMEEAMEVAMVEEAMEEAMEVGAKMEVGVVAEMEAVATEVV